MAEKNKPRAATAICGFDADNIMIRGRNLADEIMGHYSFVELLILQALGRRPSETEARLVDAVLVTIMEHGLVPSAIVTRLTHSGAPESFQGAVAAGLLGVGDRYAGTAGECGAILERIVAAPRGDREERVIAEITACRQAGRPVPGFGHPVHRGRDPRVERLLEIAKDAGVEGSYLAAMQLLEAGLRREVGKPLVTNISAAISAVLAEAGIPSRMMRGIVLTARCAGLVGHLLEESENPAADDMWMAARSAVDYRD